METKSRRFKGKVAVVTGSSRGIGRGIALELAREGAAVVVNHLRDRDAALKVVGEITAAGGNAMEFGADVGLRSEAEALVESAVREFGRLDVLVNNAGICPFREIWDITDEVWESTLRTNLYGAFVTGQAAAHVMRDRGGGSIVNISSVSSYIGSATQVHYCASKAGVNGLTASMAVALRPHNIRVNAVLPGGVPTDINRHQWAREDEPVPDAVPSLDLKRPGSPWDMARAVCYLASDDAAWVTGALLPVDGGALVSH
jgi:NAD(P)-dependent dehydrogenase (short-subunit alcohol dehydrogenase family)